MKENLIVVAAFALNPAVALVNGDGSSKASAKQPMVETDFGRTGDPRKVMRTIKVGMADTMRFTPAEISVKQGTR